MSARPVTGDAFYDEVLVLNEAGETVPLHTLGRPSRPVTPEALAEWEARTFTALRKQRDAGTPFDDELPDDPLADLDETRAALARLRLR